MSTQSQEIKDLFAALVKVQAEMRGAKKDSENPFFNASYADLESCWDACRIPLTKNGFSVIQTTDSEGDSDFLVTTLAHTSGQWIRGKLRLFVSGKKDAQALGSAITYARRYGLASIVGLIQTDDDGELAMGRANTGGSRIVPGNPGIGNGNTEPTTYRIRFGKFAQRSLEEVGVDELRGYVNYLETKAKKDGKQITGVVAEFIERASDYIASFENAPIEG